MEHYAGIDVSLDSASLCVVDATGRIVREAKLASEPDILIGWFRGLGLAVTRIGLEAGPLSQWLYAGLRDAGLAVEGVLEAHGSSAPLADEHGLARTHLPSPRRWPRAEPLFVRARRPRPRPRRTRFSPRQSRIVSVRPYPRRRRLRSNCRIVENDSPEAISAKVRAGLQEVGMDPERDSAVLLHLLGVKEVDDSPALSNPEAVKAKAFEVFRRLSVNGSRSTANSRPTSGPSRQDRQSLPDAMLLGEALTRGFSRRACGGRTT
jgi:hypothetical protein